MAHPNSAKPQWLFDLNSNHNDGFIGSTPSLSTVINATHKAFIDLNNTR
jgi:hypothetical protein